MEQSLKELLLKDLCARLPYGVKLKHIPSDEDTVLEMIGYGVIDGNIHDLIENFRPYLCPMSSMTEEEIGKYKCLNDALDENYEVHIDNAYPAFDWLNAHHFDFRNLIGLGLALEAPADMYNSKKK